MKPSWLTPMVISLLLGAVLVSAGYTYGEKQFALGEQAERSAWQTRENDQLLVANAQIKRLEEMYRQQEQDAADAIAIISFNYQKDLKHVQAEKDRAIAGLRDGTFRLRLPAASGLHPNGGAASEVATASCGCDGGKGAELSLAASEFLVGLASEADEVAKQLGRCQEVIIEDRKQFREQQ